MAEYWSNNDRGYRIRLWIDQVSQNIENNTSQVRVRLALLNQNYTFAEYNCSAYVDVNGQRLNWSGRPSVLSRNQTLWLVDQTVTIGHNADGSKAFGLSASFSGSGGWSPGTLSISGNSFTLTTIPRASSVSIGNGTMGSAVSINIQRHSSSFVHTLRYAWGNRSGDIAYNVGESYSWTIPRDFANEVSSATSGVGTLYVDTYSGGTRIGTQQVSFSATVPGDMRPSFSSISLEDTNGVARSLLNGNNFLQIISNVKVTFNGQSGAYGSWIAGYRAEIVNKNQVTYSNGGTLGFMDFQGSATIRASVLDSRGRWSESRDVTINVIEYFAPALSFTATRTRETPNIIQVVRNARIAPIMQGNQKNVMELRFKVAPLNTSNYSADNGSATGTYTTLASLTNSAANLAGNYPTNKSFVVIGTLSDKFTSTEFSVTVATESVTMSYDKDGRVGIGKIVEFGKPGSIDVKGDVYANGKQVQQLQLTQNNGRALEVGGDWNDHLNIGFYMGYNLKNAPSGGHSWKFVQVFKHLDTWVTQVAYDFQGDFVAFRSKKAGVWQPWKRLVDEQMLMSYAKQNTAVIFRSLEVSYTTRREVMLPWGVRAVVNRKGNTVTLTVIRSLYTINESSEYGDVGERLPVGFRPIEETTLTLVGNNRSTVNDFALLHLKSDGSMKLTNNTKVQRIWSGTVTYLTNDETPMV